MPIAFWRDEYKTGYAKVDEQHIHLFAIVNKLHDAMLEGHGWDVLKETLDELIHYTLEHFQMEEMLMQVNGYPSFLEHQAKHEELKQKVVLLVQKLEQHGQFLTIEVSHFLTEWLIHHIKGEDQKMIRYFHHLQTIQSPDRVENSPPLPSETPPEVPQKASSSGYWRTYPR